MLVGFLILIGPVSTAISQVKRYSKWYQIEKYRNSETKRLDTGVPPKIQMGKLNTILYTPSILNPPRNLIGDIRGCPKRGIPIK